MKLGDVVGGRYRLVQHIADGAMGRVYIAETEGLGARVAVKVLKQRLLKDEEFRIRFQREAQAVAAIDHPNVARFLDLILEEPTCLVMEYAAGPSLRELIEKEGPMQAPRVRKLAMRLCWALHAVHAAGVIHRDLKPANIVIVKTAEGEVLKLIDFGLAKLALPTQEKLTRAGEILGTPQYMAPEQIAGREVDVRSDVYALGCVMYEMLTGLPPYPDCTTDAEVLEAQVRRQPKPLHIAAPNTPPEIAAVIDRALAKLPDERFASMIELAHALETGAVPPRPSLLRRLWTRIKNA
jgi:serine/threonine-protein kinase